MAIANQQDIFIVLQQCMIAGKSVELRLRDGRTISRFRTHDMIVRAINWPNPTPDETRVRGIVWPEGWEGGHKDEEIGLSDIRGVRDEQLAFPYFADEAFFARNPVPNGWTQVGRCPRKPEN